MRLFFTICMEVWMIEIRQEKNGEYSLSFRKIREVLIRTFKTSWNLCVINIFAKALSTSLVFFFSALQRCVCCWSFDLYLKSFLKSSSRWSVTNSLVPRVLGPTNFHLKFWANCHTSECCVVLENTSEFCCVHHDLHLGSCGWTVRYAFGLLQMNVKWISGLYYEVYLCTTSECC